MKKQYYPAIWETFICTASLADYLGRSITYVRLRLEKKAEFSKAEKIAISVMVEQDWEVISGG